MKNSHKNNQNNQNNQKEINGGLWGIPEMGLSNFFGMSKKTTEEKENEVKEPKNETEIINILQSGNPDEIRELINTFGKHMNQIDMYMKCFAGVITQMKQNDIQEDKTEIETEDHSFEDQQQKGQPHEEEQKEKVQPQEVQPQEKVQPQEVQPQEVQPQKGGARSHPRKTRKHKNHAKKRKTRRNDNLIL